MSEVIRVLSIDGGGIRGLIPLVILAKIEEQIPDRPISEMFHLVAGTSTGGIIAAALSTKKPGTDRAFSAKEILDFYVEHGKEIFTPNLWGFKRFWDEGYSAENFERLLAKKFGDLKLSDATCSDLLLTTYDIKNRKPFIFKSWRANGENLDLLKDECDSFGNANFIADDENFKLRDVLRATSAAPTYFEPIRIKSVSGNELDCVDGGVFANNPAMCAVSAAYRIYRMNRQDDFCVVSLGTGTALKSIDYEKARDWGLLYWARPIIDILFDGAASTVDYQLQTVLGGERNEEGDGAKSYFRFDLDLKNGQGTTNKASYRLDDASDENIEALLEAGKAVADSSNLEKLLTLLRDVRPSDRDKLIARTNRYESPIQS